MSLWDHRNFILPWREAGFGRGGGPPARSNLLAWLSGGTDDGIEALDKLEVLDAFEARDINCLTSSGGQTISNANILDGDVITQEGTATGTSTAGVITFTAGTISNVSIVGVLTYVCEEGSGFPMDVSGNGNHITSMTTTWTTSDDIPSTNYEEGFTLLENLYTVIEPTSGYVVAMDMVAGDIGDLLDLTASMIYEAQNDKSTFSITNNSTLTIFNPNSYTINDLYDIAGTIADELWSGFSTYTITEPTGGWVREFNPNTATNDILANVLATFIYDATR